MLAVRRRRLVLEMNGPGCDVDQANAMLEKAGVDCRLYAGLTFERAHRKLFDAARKAGLL